MKIITVAHQKGGVGKTTLVLNLAACLSVGLRVGVVDTDLQGSLHSVKDDLNGVVFIQYDGNTHNLLHQNLDILIIDTPPYVTSKLSDIFAVSDFVLIPTKVGFFDVEAVKVTIKLVEDLRRKSIYVKHGVVLNMVKPRTGLTKSIHTILVDYGASVLATSISDRVSYTRSSIMSGVFSGEDEKAKEEITDLADEILTAIGL